MLFDNKSNYWKMAMLRIHQLILDIIHPCCTNMQASNYAGSSIEALIKFIFIHLQPNTYLSRWRSSTAFFYELDFHNRAANDA
jgi:hypothetical protein